MSAWGAFAGGVGGAAAQLSGKYIDDELLQQRAQALSDMQSKARRADVMWEQSDEVQAPRLANAKRAQQQSNEVALEQQAATRNQTNKLNIDDSKNPELVKLAELDAANKSKYAVQAAKDLLPGQIELNAAQNKNQADGQIRVENAKGANLLKAIGARSEQGGKADKMDEADKLEYQSLLGGIKAATEHLSKFEAEGQPFDKEGRPTPQYELLKGNAAKAAKATISFQMRKGLADPAADARMAISGEQDASKIGMSIGQAYEMGGGDYGDKFFDAVRKSGRLEELAGERMTTPSAKPDLLSQARAAGRGQPDQPPKQPKDKLAELQKRIAADNAIKNGGFGGMGARAIQSRTFPMGLGERRSVEEEINRLMGN